MPRYNLRSNSTSARPVSVDKNGSRGKIGRTHMKNLRRANRFFVDNFAKCSGDWLGKKSGYESALCSQLPGVSKDDGRYWDAFLDGTVPIEFKKGKTGSFWFDRIRYSEMLLNTDVKTRRATVTALLIPHRNDTSSIKEIHLMDTNTIIDYLRLNKREAKNSIRRRKLAPRQVNEQYCMALSDVRDLARFSIFDPEMKNLDKFATSE